MADQKQVQVVQQVPRPGQPPAHEPPRYHVNAGPDGVIPAVAPPDPAVKATADFAIDSLKRSDLTITMSIIAPCFTIAAVVAALYYVNVSTGYLLGWIANYIFLIPLTAWMSIVSHDIERRARIAKRQDIRDFRSVGYAVGNLNQRIVLASVFFGLVIVFFVILAIITPTEAISRVMLIIVEGFIIITTFYVARFAHSNADGILAEDVLKGGVV